jgi:hypothetical protein
LLKGEFSFGRLKPPSSRGDVHGARSHVAALVKCAACLFSIGVSGAQGACSLLLDTSIEQCTTDDDCANRGGRFEHATCLKSVCVARPLPNEGGINEGGGTGAGPDVALDVPPADPVWGCLGHVVIGTPQTPTVKVTIPFWDLIRAVPVTDVVVRACPKLDVTCSRPMTTFVAADALGVVTLEVAALFDGYGQVLSAHSVDAGDDAGDDGGDDAGDDAGTSRWIPSLLFFNAPPLVRDTTYIRVPLFTADDIKLLAQVQGNTWDPAFGIALAGMLDCSAKPAAGVTWQPSVIDPKSKRFFYINSFPDEAATSTDATGLGGLLNAPTGTLTLNASVLATGKHIGSATMVVRAGLASYTYLMPTP